MNSVKVAIIGTVGVPNVYGGFEALAENLVKDKRFDSLVVCSAKSYPIRKKKFHFARLIYLPINANGIWSVPYDFVSALVSIVLGYKKLLFLGNSGAVFFPFIRIFFPWVTLYVNFDGIEHRRKKFRGLTRMFLRMCAWFVAVFSHHVIADNTAVEEYLKNKFNLKSKLIGYGGDHVLSSNDSQELIPEGIKQADYDFNFRYFFGVCRIEPENNIHLVLEAFESTGLNIVLVGNWEYSDYGRQLKSKYALRDGFYLLDPIYDLSVLRYLRERSCGYIHGHSAGGTNPSLVEALFFSAPILAFDCNFNRYTLNNIGLFFSDVQSLRSGIQLIDSGEAGTFDYTALRNIYSWKNICDEYYGLLNYSD